MIIKLIITFQMLDVDSDGVVSFEDFMSCCLEDQTINQSLKAFECIRIMA